MTDLFSGLRVFGYTEDISQLATVVATLREFDFEHLEDLKGAGRWVSFQAPKLYFRDDVVWQSQRRHRSQGAA